MPNTRSLKQLQAEIKLLPLARREDLRRSVAAGRAVETEEDAALASEFARADRTAIFRALVLQWVILWVVFVTVLAYLAAAGKPVSGMWVGAVITIVIPAVWLWVRLWRPRLRAERANLALAHHETVPVHHERGHWIAALWTAWILAAMFGLILHLLGVGRVPAAVGFGVVVLLSIPIKRAIDERAED